METSALLFEPDPGRISPLIEEELGRAGYALRLRRAASLEAMADALAESWDLILCHCDPPGLEAALALCREQAPDTPLIVLSGSIGAEAAVGLLKAGVGDVVLTTGMSRLGPAVERELAEADRRRRRRQENHALRASEELYRRLVENSPDVIFRYRLRPRPGLEHVSAAVTRVGGYAPAELYAAPDLACGIAHPDDRLLLEHLVRARSPTVAVARFHAKHGRTVWAELRTAPVLDGKGRLVAVEGVARDVSERELAARAAREAEQELRQTLELVRRLDEERRRLLERLVQAQEEERRRIAADIHDEPVQVLTALALRLDVLREKLDDPELGRSIEEIAAIVRTSIAKLRHLMFDLRPPALDRDGLAAALRAYLEQLQEEHGLVSTLADRMGWEPSPETRTILYRIAQEALTNVVKHARASLVEVELSSIEEGVLVRIRDDGRGFSLRETEEEPSQWHVGLAAMRERAAMAGGWWRIESRPGAGTTVEFFVPDQGSE